MYFLYQGVPITRIPLTPSYYASLSIIAFEKSSRRQRVSALS